MPDPIREDRPLPSLRTSLAWSSLAFLCSFGFYTLVWATFINPFYFPYGDSFSVLVNSVPPFHPVFSSWFLHGFQSYFNVYPDLSLHGTDFIRPVVNGTFFLGWFAYGSHWSRYLLTTYAIIGMLSATVCFLAGHVLKLGWRIALVATLCVSIAPSIDSGVLFDPTFAFDLLGGLLILLALTALIFDALPFAWIFLALAAFTKETALFAPLLTAIVVFLRGSHRPLPRRAAISAAFLLPIIAWLALRLYDFRGEKGVYVFLDGSSHGPIHVMLVRIILGLLNWPLAATVFWVSIPRLLQFLQKATILINIVFWITLASILVKKLFKNGIHLAALSNLFKARGEKYAIALISLFCAVSLLTPLALNIPRRFGGVFFPLFILCLAYTAHYAKNNPIRIASAAMIGTVGITGLLLITSDLHYQSPWLKSTWAMARDYSAQLSAANESAVFTIDDLSGRYASTEYVRRFTGYKGQLVRLNDMQWSFECHQNTRTAIAFRADRVATITSVVPAQCGDHVFNSVFPPVDPKLTSFTRNLPSATARYHLMHQIDAASKPNANQLQVELQSNLPDSVILVADPANLRYRRVPLAPASGETQ